MAKLRSTDISTGKDVEQEELLFTGSENENLERFGIQFRNFYKINHTLTIQFSSVQ